MATKALLVVVVAMAAAAMLGTALGASYTVGAPGGAWDLRTNYTRWASTVNFRAGDQLLFKYSRAAHDVVEVSKADYDSCSRSSPIATFQTGDDVVPLAAAGSRYFICGVPGHCDNGMKVAVKVEAADGGNTAPSPVATPPAVGGGQAMPPSSSAASAGVKSVLGALVFGGLMVFYF